MLGFPPKSRTINKNPEEIIYFEKCFQSLGMGSRGESEREGGKGNQKVPHRVGYCVGSSGPTPEGRLRMVHDVRWSCLSKTEMEFLVTGSQRKVKGCPSNSPTGKRAGALQTSPIKWAKPPLDKRLQRVTMWGLWQSRAAASCSCHCVGDTGSALGLGRSYMPRSN